LSKRILSLKLLCEWKEIGDRVLLLPLLLQLSCHSVAVVLTLVQTKQIRINMHKGNNTKTQYKQYKHSKYKYTYYQNTDIIVKSPPHTLTHTLQNKLKKPKYKLHT
jgi:hypothetical protein